MTTALLSRPALRFIRSFDEISIDDISLVGGKNASLGEMIRELRPQGVRLADGFAITAEAYREFLREAGLDQRIDSSRRVPISTTWPACSSVAGKSSAIVAAGLPHELAGRNRRRLRPIERPARRTPRRRRSQQRHGRGLARRQFRRPAGNVSQCPGTRGAARRLPPLFRVAVHRPGDFLPRGQGIRSFRSPCRSACNGWCAPTWPRPA